MPAAPRVLTFCILPRDLMRLHRPLVRWAATIDGVNVVVERRAAGADRRQATGQAPDGVERRVGPRRAAAQTVTLAQVGMDLPWTLRRHADRIAFVRRRLPAALTDDLREVDGLLQDAILGDAKAHEELWLRQYDFVFDMVSISVPPRKAARMTDKVFAELLRGDIKLDYMQAVVEARDRALAS